MHSHRSVHAPQVDTKFKSTRPAVHMCAHKRKLLSRFPDDDGTPSLGRARARAEASLGVMATADQVARSIMFRFRAPHIPHLVERNGRVHFQLRSKDEVNNSEPMLFDYRAQVTIVADALNTWLVGGTVCEAILNADDQDCISDRTHDPSIVLDIMLEVRTQGTVSEEWKID